MGGASGTGTAPGTEGAGWNEGFLALRKAQVVLPYAEWAQLKAENERLRGVLKGLLEGDDASSDG